MESVALHLNNNIAKQETKATGFNQSFESSVLFPNQFLFLYNTYSAEIIYHKGFKAFVGINHQLITKKSLINLVHPEDQEKVQLIYNKVYRFWLQNPVAAYQQVFAITYRIKKADGKFYNVYCQTMIIERQPKGLVSMNMVSDITQFQTGANVLWSLKGKGSHQFYEKNRTDNQEQNLTGRELEIVKCLAKGMDSKEIAIHLNISLYTVYTHRRNMLARMKFENIMQLVNFALKKGLINV